MRAQRMNPLFRQCWQEIGNLKIGRSHGGSPLLHQHAALLVLSMLLQQAQLIADIVELVPECFHLHGDYSL